MITTGSILTLFLAFLPNFDIYDRVRHIDGEDILTDVRSHLYDDKMLVTMRDYPSGTVVSQDVLNISSVHESTHGINSFLREKYSTKTVKVNGFYCLNNNFIVIRESNLKLTDVANKVPRSIRFVIYDSAFSKMRLGDWNDRCLYLCDEFVAHTNGSMYRKQKKIGEGAYSLKFGIEYGMYSLVHLQMLKGSDYSDYEKLKSFLEWNFNRCFDLYDGDVPTADNMRAFIKSEDCGDLRRFIFEEFGQEFYSRLTKIGS